MSELLKPTPSLLCKLASAVVHADEFLSVNGHAADRIALNSILADPEVKAWIEAMSAASLAPMKRSQT
jgi:hypothetical protein